MVDDGWQKTGRLKYQVNLTRLGLNTKFTSFKDVFDVILLLHVHGKQLWSCRDDQLVYPHFSWAGLDLPSD